MVALRKESVDRNLMTSGDVTAPSVALRKESVDRNIGQHTLFFACVVALRKESVDRNTPLKISITAPRTSLSARRAWIEIVC